MRSAAPEDFIIDLDEMSLYADGVRDRLLTTNDGAILPKHYSLLHSRRILREFTLSQSSYDGFTVTFLPFAGSHTSNDGYYAQSFLVLDLGPDYAGVQLPRETSPSAFPFEVDSALHYFSLSDIVPYDKDFFESIIIGADIDAPFFSQVAFRGYGFFLPGPVIDLSGYQNPEIVFFIDTENLVEVYDSGTPHDFSDDQVSLNLSNPFPMTVQVQEASTVLESETGADTTSCAEVKYLDIAGANTANALIWINPLDLDFDRVRIVRKAGSAPANAGDGELVYDGYVPNYLDETGTPGVHYYYRVMTVDFAGNVSEGLVVDQVQAEL